MSKPSGWPPFGREAACALQGAGAVGHGLRLPALPCAVDWGLAVMPIRHLTPEVATATEAELKARVCAKAAT